MSSVPQGEPRPIPVQPVLALGHLGATYFFVLSCSFVLSGFGLTWSWSDRAPPSTFVWRRFAQIYSVHFVALVIAVPVFYAIAPAPNE